jgi:hypothetical protein
MGLLDVLSGMQNPNLGNAHQVAVVAVAYLRRCWQ